MTKMTIEEVGEALKKAPEGSIFILRDCGCRAVIDFVKQHAKIEYCPLHEAAPIMLGICKDAIWEDIGDNLESRINAIIQSVEGKRDEK